LVGSALAATITNKDTIPPVASLFSFHKQFPDKSGKPIRSESKCLFIVEAPSKSSSRRHNQQTIPPKLPISYIPVGELEMALENNLILCN